MTDLMQTNMITVEQLPVIKQNLLTVKQDVERRTARAASLVCTEENVKEVKKDRAELNKEFSAFEDARKNVKAAILKPYEEFEEVYKDCVAGAYKKADEALKAKIADVENALKAERQAAFDEYFAKKRAETGIDFVVPEQVGIKITLSGSAESYKKAADEFFDKVAKELDAISKIDDAPEILYEYKRHLDFATALATVTNRKVALKAQAEAEKNAAEDVQVEQAQETPETEGFDVWDSLPPWSGAAEAVEVPEAEFFEEPAKEYIIKIRAGKRAFEKIALYLSDGGIDWEVLDNDNF